ncbi:MAG: hypothetical protein ACLFUC_11795 [Bacteroidales bacterium]
MTATCAALVFAFRGNQSQSTGCNDGIRRGNHDHRELLVAVGSLHRNG